MRMIFGEKPKSRFLRTTHKNARDKRA